MDPGSLSALAKVLRPIGDMAVRGAARLNAERVAANEPNDSVVSFLDASLDETLDRLCGGRVDDTWWRRLLAVAEQTYVAPGWLTEARVQEWLSTEAARWGVHAIAKARIIGTPSADEERIRGRLIASFPAASGAGELAEDAIDVVVAVLVAGYLATIPRDLRPLAGLVQEIHREASHARRRDTTNLARDGIVEDIHNEQVERQLIEILTLRKFDFAQATERVHALWHRIGDDHGDLATCTDALKRRVQYWTARLSAVENRTLDRAKSLRRGLRPGDVTDSLLVLDAWITATDGDSEKAIRKLRRTNDADARTTLLTLVVREHGAAAGVKRFANADPTVDPQTFTDIGWKLWAVCLAKLDRWDEAVVGLRALADSPAWGPALAAVEGTMNAALLLPNKQRLAALGGPPYYSGIAPRLGSLAEKHRVRAYMSFDYAQSRLAGIADDGLARYFAAWIRWVRLMDPDKDHRQRWRDDVREQMSDGLAAVDLIPAAWAFGIEFETNPLRDWLEQSKEFGGLDDEELVAECLLNNIVMKPREFAAYVEDSTEELDRVFGTAEVTAMLFEAWLHGGEIDRARDVLDRREATIDETMRTRMSAAIDAEAGEDPRVALEEAYERTNDLVDLQNLIAHLRSVGDSDAVGPLIRQLFDEAPTLENASQVVDHLSRPEMTNYGLILDFLDEHPQLADQSDELKSARAWALFHMGELAEAKSVNEALLRRRRRESDLALDLNIAVACGDWEHLPEVVNRGWQERAELGAATLIMLARHEGRSERAIALARLAVTRAPDDARVLAAAYALHFELGFDQEADPSWLEKALSSSTTDGPVWETDLEQMVTEILPRQREHQGRIERLLMEGRLPMVLAFGSLNVPLCRAMLEVAGRSSETSDGRRRVMLPIVSGARSPVEIGSESIALDVTSILVLDSVGLLDQALDSFGHVKLPAEAMETLYFERLAVRFHQPTRVRSAKAFRQLVDHGRLQVVDSATAPTSLVEEVAGELAELLATARRDDGVVVCARPIYQAGSLMEVEADTSAYDDLIYSPWDLCEAVRRRGLIDRRRFAGGMRILGSQGQRSDRGMNRTLLSGPIFLDRLALSHIQNARLLEFIADPRLNIQVHQNVLDEAVALIDAEDSGDDVANRIDRIRLILRSKVESGKVSFLPLAKLAQSETPDRSPGVRSMEALIAGANQCDAVCVDDRYVNTHKDVRASSGDSVPMVCVLDLLRHMRKRDAISAVEHWQAKHTLRNAGFAFIPLEVEELLHWLRSADFDDRHVDEGAELKVLRQSVNLLDSLGVLSSAEAVEYAGAMVMSCTRAIRTLWEDSSMPIDRVEVLADWVWRHLVGRSLIGKGPFIDTEALDIRTEGLGSRIGTVALPLVTESPDRRAAYGRWLESVFAAYRPANGSLIDHVLSQNISNIKASPSHGRIVGGMFLEGIPESLRQRAMVQDPTFAKECGYETGTVVNIGTGATVSATELFKAAEKVFAGVPRAVIENRIGGELSVSAREDTGDRLVVEFSDADNNRITTEFAELSLLSPNGGTRHQALGEILARTGPTTRIPARLFDDVKDRKLSEDEILDIALEVANGIGAFRSRFESKVSSRVGLTVADFAPPLATYWEQLCGPSAVDMDADAYFCEKLTPHRMGILRQDLARGLEICCIGALHDDLLPGRWLDRHDNDQVWEALSSIDLRGNPVALLSALDVALFRVSDQRFRDYAASATKALVNDNLDVAEGHEVYRLFRVVCDFVFNAMSFVDGIPEEPGYWRRMGAWMQAGLIVHALVADRAPVGVAQLEKWCNENMAFGGDVRRLADCRMEPLVLGSQLGAKSLRYEVAVRLVAMKARHEATGRVVPMAGEIDAALRRMGESGARAVVPVPGPCVLHRRPVEPMPAELQQWLTELWQADDDSSHAVEVLAGASQLFAVDDHSVGLVNGTVAASRGTGKKFADVLPGLYSASVIAVSLRNIELADAIGKAVVDFASNMSSRHELEWAVRLLLQTAAARPGEEEWFRWLADSTATLAMSLPPEPHLSLRTLLWYLEGIEPVLPVRQWFHLRARCIATAGADHPSRT